MRDKYDYLHSFDTTDPVSTAETMAVFGAFTEGLQLFASFAILLNFPRFNKMKGMGQIVTWSIRDETLHTESIIRLYHTYVKENLTEKEAAQLRTKLHSHVQKVVTMEDAFIDLAFEAGDIQGMKPLDIKRYIRYIANLRMKQLGMEEVYNIKENPLPWMEEMLNVQEHTNFFENQSTEYGKAATKGEWDDVF